MPRHADLSRRAGDRWVGVGAAVFGVGVVAVLVALVLFLAGGDVPTWLVLTAATLPLGLGVALVGLLRSVLSRPGAD